MIPLGILAVAGAANGGGGAYEWISTTTLTSTASGVTFSSIPSTYKHLQIRMNISDGDSASLNGITAKFNSDTGANYYSSWLRGTGSAVEASYGGPLSLMEFTQSMGGDYANVFSPQIMDILDYTGTKFKTVKLFNGMYSTSGTARVNMFSGHWRNTSAINTILIEPKNFDGSPIFKIGSRFSLYGIKG